MSAELEKFLLQFKGEDILYFPNPGNAGDSVIATATYQLFDRLGLHYSTPRFGGCNLKDRIVIYGGGGNLVGSRTSAHRVAQAAHAQAKRFIILPHTVKSVSPLLGAFDKNVDVICREAVSYKYVSSEACRANVYLMDDVAFSLNVQDALRGAPIISPFARLLSYAISKPFSRINVPTLGHVMRAAHIKNIESSLQSLQGSEEIFCFRTDGEKTDIPIPPSNIDLSTVFEFGVATKDVAYLSARSVLQFLSNFKVVHTNRLHMAISGALLGLDVHFHANSYYKCRAVYEHSMKGRFDNVHWMQ